MSRCDVKQNALCKSLGPDYRILCIDLERCIYRDFGNGFDVEISGTYTTSNRKTAIVYLWYVPEKITVKRVSGVKQSEIGNGRGRVVSVQPRAFAPRNHRPRHFVVDPSHGFFVTPAQGPMNPRVRYMSIGLGLSRKFSAISNTKNQKIKQKRSNYYVKRRN